MRKIFLLLAGVAVLTGLAMAAGQSFTPVGSPVEPGGSTVLGNLTVSSVYNNTSVSSTNDFDFPFSVSWDNSVRSNDSHAVFYGNLTGNISGDFPAGSYSNSFQVKLFNESISTTVSYSVAEVQNWTVYNSSVPGVVSLGENDKTASFFFRNSGNADVDVGVNASGNLTDFFFRVPDSVSILRGQEDVLRLEYEVPRDTSPGFYSGVLNFTGGGISVSRNFSTVFKDDTHPEIRGVDFPGGMATTGIGQSVEVTDNVGVETVTVNISRGVNVTQGNTTTLENQTVASFEMVQDGGTWTYDFSETGEIDTYFADIKAVDGAGLTDNASTSFEVIGLNASHVLNENFNFSKVRPETEVSQPILLNDIQTPVDLRLETFSRTGNSSITVGVRKSGEATPELFSLGDLPDTITVRQAGTYELVVESDAVERYSGQINVSPVPQHYPVPDILFSGRFVDPRCPPETNGSIGAFSGRAYYTSGGCLQGDAVIELRVPGSQVIGSPSWKDQFPGFTWGELETARTEREEAFSARDSWRNLAYTGWMLALLVFLLGVSGGRFVWHRAPFKRNVNLKGKTEAAEPGEYS